MPTTTTGLATSFITFSRPGATGGGATVTDRDGRIKWAGHNLAVDSENFKSSNWIAASTTVTANAAAAPDNTTTADRANVSAGGALYQIGPIILGAKYKIAVWAKSFGGTNQTFRLYGDGSLNSGDLTATSSWQLFEYEFTSTTGGATRTYGLNVGTANNAFDILVWGAHLYRSDLGGMQQNPAMGAGMGSYYPTTPRNLLGNTEAVGSWTAIGTPTITANTDIAPNGLQTADTISDTNASGYQGVRLTYPSVNGGIYTGSIHIKKTGATSYPVFQVYKDSTNTACGLIVNVAAGTVAVISGAGYAAPDAYNIVSVGDYWRVWIRVTATSTGSAGFDFYPAGSTDGTTISSSATGSAVIWGAQLSDSASLDTYVPQYGAAVTSAAYYAPRLDFDPVTLAARGLLVEEQRVNGLTYSNDFGNGVWFKTRASISAGTYVSPDGVTTASLFKEDTSTSATHDLYVSFSSTIGVTYTYSIFARQNPSAKRNLVFNLAANNFVQTKFNLETGTFTQGSGHTASIIPFGNGWFRCIVTVTATTTNGSLYLQLVDPVTDSVTYTGDGTSGVHVYGAQVESNASFATSYIPTGASTATRTADVASVSTQAFPYSGTEGTLVMSLSSNDGKTLASLSDGTGNNRMSSTAGSQYHLYVASGGAEQANIDAGTFTPNTNGKLAFAYATNNFAAVINGGTVATANSGTVPTVNKLSIGMAGDNTGQINGWVRQITYIPRRLTAAELQSRTA